MGQTETKANSRSEAAKKAAATRKANREAKAAEQAKAEAKAQGRVAYTPGDEQTHATGKKRLGVERGDGCVCGCGQMPLKKRSRFIPGHDARMYALAKAIKAHRAGELEEAPKVTPRQKAYLEGRNLI